MYQLFSDHSIETGLKESNEEIDAFLIQYGWTRQELVNAVDNNLVDFKSVKFKR